MGGFLLLCFMGFWTVTSGQPADSDSLVIFKAICENGTEGCTVKENCTTYIRAEQTGIRIIEDSTLSSCSDIETLNLEFNKISEISKKFFSGAAKSSVVVSQFQSNKSIATGCF
jgi:hypothetical protein